MNQHNWEDFGGSGYLCRKCDSYWHPAWGPMPKCVNKG